MSSADDPLPDLIRGLRSPLPDQRVRSARALGRLGWLARDAVSLLVAAVNDPEGGVREAAAQAVGQMGPDAMPHLVRMLTHDDKYVRRHAVWALGKLGPAARSVLGDIALALQDSDPRTASGAAQALGALGEDAADAVAPLAEAMRGTNIVLCRLAAKALSQIGRPALPTLVAHLRHRDPFVRGEAALALGWIGPPAAVAVPALTEVLRAGLVASVGRPVPAAVSTQTPVTAVNLTPPPPSADDSSRAYAAQALGRIGPAAAAALSVLQQATLDSNEQVRQSASAAIRLVQAAV